MVVCAYCKKNFLCISHFKVHLPCRHGGSVFSRFVCGEDGCGRVFDKWKMFKSHLTKLHKIVNVIDSKLVNSTVCEFSTIENIEPPNNSDESGLSFDNSQDIQPEISASNFKVSYQKNVEVLVAKLYKNPSIPRNFVQTLVDDLNNFLTDGFIDILKSKVLSALGSAQASESSVTDITQIFDCIRDPFSGLNTDYRRMEYFKANKCFIPPVQYVISESRSKLVNTSSGPEVRRVKTTGQYVPLRLILKKLFELPGALSSTLHYIDFLKHCTSDVKINVIQSEQWQNKVKAFFSDTDLVIPLNFYYDDVEPNADLGPHSEKLGAGYTMIPVLPPDCLSKLENILLTLLIDADDRKSNVPGKVSFNEEVFKPIVAEFNFLEKSGIVCQTDDIGDRQVYFILDRVIGDNLGVHGLLGFAEGFTANYCCTICRAPKFLTQTLTREDSSFLRNSENYAADVRANDLSQTGVKEECVFNKVRSFHVVNNQCVDFMHDGPEGVCHYVLIPVLKHCIDSKFFPLSTLNSRMYFFDFGLSDSSNKPVCIADDFHSKSKLKGTAREILTLVRLLGILVGDLVPEGDPFWQLYLLHKDIIEICLAKHLPVEVADELDLLIHEHHSLYLQLVSPSFPPKFHYLTHYGRIIRNHAPPTHFSSMRGESKHREVVTKYASAMSCRKNLPFSVATKHQLSLCFRFVSKTPFMPQITCGPGDIMELEEHLYYLDIKSKLPRNFQGQILCVNWIELSGTLYKPKMVLVCGVDEQCVKFKFCKIIDIFVHKSKPLFVCQRLTNLGYNEHVGGYQVSNSTRFVCVFHNDLWDPFPLYDFSMCNGEKYVVLKHYM